MLWHAGWGESYYFEPTGHQGCYRWNFVWTSIYLWFIYCQLHMAYMISILPEFLLLSIFNSISGASQQSILSTKSIYPMAMGSNFTLSDVATPYSKRATPYTIGLWRNSNSKWLLVDIFSLHQKSVFALLWHTQAFSGFPDQNCTVSLCATPYISSPVTRFFFYILYCPVSLHRTAWICWAHLCVCTVGSYALLSVCLSGRLSLDQNSGD